MSTPSQAAGLTAVGVLRRLLTSIGTELTNFAQHNFPLNVLITYTGNRSEYLIKRHSALMSSITGELRLILNPETYWPDSHQRGLRIPWEYYLWSNGGLRYI